MMRPTASQFQLLPSPRPQLPPQLHQRFPVGKAHEQGAIVGSER